MPNKISRPEHHLRTADAVPTMTQQHDRRSMPIKRGSYLNTALKGGYLNTASLL